MTAFNDVTEQALRELSQLRAGEESFLSFYLDLDPSRFATAPARASEADSLLDAAHREIETGQRPHAELMALRDGLQRARGTLTDLGPLAEGARALALFVCTPLEVDRALRLPHPTRSGVVLGQGPFIAPLFEEGPRGRVCVLLVDERSARVLVGAPEALREGVSFGDDVHGHQSQGGWSQARYQRSEHEEVRGHLRHVARVLQDLLKIWPFQRLLVACSEPLWPRVVEALHPDVRARLHNERMRLDEADATLQQVRDAATSQLADERRAREEELLGALREHLGREDARAVAGLQDVLGALVQRRVGVLLYDEGRQAPGVRCARCGWMDLEGRVCPVDGSELQGRENIVEDALQAAVAQDAEVVALRERPDLGPLGGVAALLRF